MADFERLALLFKRTRGLPELPGCVTRLVAAIDAGDASAIDLERIIASDPALSVRILSIANVGLNRSAGIEITTIRAAILRLGQRAVRSLAVSLIMQNLWGKPDDNAEFDSRRFAHHSLFTAFMTRYLYARRHMQAPFNSEWSADEMFSAGLLHDLGTALLYRVAPEIFLRVQMYSRRLQITLDEGFLKIFDHRISELGSLSSEAWGLPGMFGKVIQGFPEPWTFPEEFTALSCVHYANYLASILGAGIEDWPVNVQVEPEADVEVGVPQEEIAKVAAIVEAQVSDFIANATLAA